MCSSENAEFDISLTGIWNISTDDKNIVAVVSANKDKTYTVQYYDGNDFSQLKNSEEKYIEDVVHIAKINQYCYLHRYDQTIKAYQIFRIEVKSDTLTLYGTSRKSFSGLIKVGKLEAVDIMDEDDNNIIRYTLIKGKTDTLYKLFWDGNNTMVDLFNAITITFKKILLQ